MDELTNLDNKKNLVGLFHGIDTGADIPVPYERDIFLFDTRVAGTMYCENIEELADKLEAGSRLSFYREPNNEHDNLAIVIKTLENQKIGYVPRRDNPVFARLMDAGKELFGKVKSIYKLQRNDNYFNNRIETQNADESETHRNDYYIGINIEIYLHED